MCTRFNQGNSISFDKLSLCKILLLLKVDDLRQRMIGIKQSILPRPNHTNNSCKRSRCLVFLRFHKNVIIFFCHRHMMGNFSETDDMEKESTCGLTNRPILEHFIWTKKKATEHSHFQIPINSR